MLNWLARVRNIRLARSSLSLLRGGNRKLQRRALSSSSTVTDFEQPDPPQATERKETQMRDAVYTSDPNVANIVAEALKSDIAANRYILEANPGEGILSRRLLDMGCKHLFLFEPAWSSFLPGLEKLVAEQPTRVKLARENLVRMASMQRYDVINGTNRVRSCFKDIPHQQWAQEPRVTLVLTLPKTCERKYLLALLYAFVGRTGIFSLGRIDILMFVSKEEHARVISVKKKSSRSAPVLFNLFFEQKFLGSVGTMSFRNNSGSKMRHSCKVMNLVRLRPKMEVSHRLSEPHRIEEFSFFVRQAFTRGATLMYLNQLIPDAVRFILLKTRWSGKEILNLQPNTKLYKLSPAELLRLFEILSEHDLFPQCPLSTALDSDYFQKGF